MKVTYRQRLRYWFDNTMSKGTPALIGWLGVVVLAMVLIGAVAMAFAGPAEITNQGPGEAAWQSLMRVLDPGTVTADIGWPFRLLSLGVTFGGILIFSALIGVLTTGLDAKLEELRKGRSQVLESDHTGPRCPIPGPPGWCAVPGTRSIRTTSGWSTRTSRGR